MASRTRHTAARLANAFGIKHVFSDWRQLVDLPEVHIVDVSFPFDSDRLEIVEYAASRGQHLLIEKPLAHSMDKAYPGQLVPTPRARIHLKLPFDRYYMEENQAPRAEQAYWDHSRNRALERMTVSIRILDGKGLIENLWIGDRTIGEYLKSKDK